MCSYSFVYFRTFLAGNNVAEFQHSFYHMMLLLFLLPKLLLRQVSYFVSKLTLHSIYLNELFKKSLKYYYDLKISPLLFEQTLSSILWFCCLMKPYISNNYSNCIFLNFKLFSICSFTYEYCNRQTSDDGCQYGWYNSLQVNMLYNCEFLHIGSFCYLEKEMLILSKF